MNVRSLRDKYLEIRRLRVLHGAPDEPDPRDALRTLADRFPGALRELDRLPLAEIDARIRALEEADEQHRVELWMEAQIVFHAELRGALRAKRWLGSRREVDEAMRRAFSVEVADADARRWAEALELLARPTGGRLLTVVIARVAASLGCSTDEVRVRLG